MKVDPNFRNAQSFDGSDSGSSNKPYIKLVACIVGAGILLAAYFAYQQPQQTILPPIVVAKLGSEGMELIQHIEREPCNLDLATELATKLAEINEYSALINFYDSHAQRCGKNKELLAPVFTAQMGLARYAEAEKTADSLVTEYPADPSAYGWRAEAREKNNNPSGAYADMQYALLLFPDPSNVAGQVYYDTARLAAQTGHPCEAVAIMRDYVAYNAIERKTQQITTMTKDWQRQGACPSLAGVGSALVRYNKNDTSIVVPVEINGIAAHMIVDTGATTTLLTADLARRANIQTSGKSGQEFLTANGSTWAAGGRADSIAVGNASLKNVSVHIHNSSDGSFGAGIDGLLGLSFLGNFQVRLSDGVLELKPQE